MKRKFFAATAFALLLCLALSACSSAKEEENFSRVHVKNSGKNLVYEMIRDSSYFKDAEIDGNLLTQNENYSIEENSKNITFHAEYFDTLEAGTHAVTVYFKDGVKESVKITVEETGK